MSNSFNEDYNTYLLEKSILETSKPPINNIETIENIEDKPEKSIEDTLLELENNNNILQKRDNKIVGGALEKYIFTYAYNFTNNTNALLQINKKNPNFSLINHTARLTNFNTNTYKVQQLNSDTPQSLIHHTLFYNTLIDGITISYTQLLSDKGTAYNNIKTTYDAYIDALDALEIINDPTGSGNYDSMSLVELYNTKLELVKNNTVQIRAANDAYNNARTAKTNLINAMAYATRNGITSTLTNLDNNFTKSQLNSVTISNINIGSINNITTRSNANYTIFKKNTDRIELRDGTTVIDNDLTLPDPANSSDPTMVESSITIEYAAEEKIKLKFIIICWQLKNLYRDINKWEKIMKKYLNAITKTQSSISTIIDAIKTQDSYDIDTQNQITIDLSLVILNDQIMNPDSLDLKENELLNQINKIIVQIPAEDLLPDLQLFTSTNNKEIRWIIGIILIILFGICIYKLDFSKFMPEYLIEFIKLSIFIIISTLILFMEVGYLIKPELLAIESFTINNDITMSVIYICLIILIYGIFNYIYNTDDTEITNVYIIAITICISLGVIWIGNTIFYKIFSNKEAQEKQLKNKLNKNDDEDNWIQYSFPVMIFLYICTFIYYLNKKPLFIQEQSNLFVLFSFIITIILGVIYFITNKSIYVYNLLGSSGIITVILSILILIYKFTNNSGLEAPKIGYNYLLDIVPIYLLLLSTIINISTLNINQLVIGASIEVIIRLFIIVYIAIGVNDLTGKEGYLFYHIYILVGCLTMILFYNSEDKIMKLEEFNVSYSVISPFMNLIYFMFIVN
tara:strand:- start:17 stop:2413 length:2397 start_codon:yes stop_codon:yes gene_type:complete